MGRHCEKSLIVQDRTRNLLLWKHCTNCSNRKFVPVGTIPPDQTFLFFTYKEVNWQLDQTKKNKKKQTAQPRRRPRFDPRQGCTAFFHLIQLSVDISVGKEKESLVCLHKLLSPQDPLQESTVLGGNTTGLNHLTLSLLTVHTIVFSYGGGAPLTTKYTSFTFRGLLIKNRKRNGQKTIDMRPSPQSVLG